MDTLYITTAQGGKVDDPHILQLLEQRVSTLIAKPETQESGIPTS
jgi:hypothetical protein